MSQGLIQGSMREAPLPDIIQLVSQGGKTGCFHVQEDPKKARIFLKAGRIIHAVTNENEGLEAIYQVALWLDGTYHFEEAEVLVEPTITKPNPSILMEMHRRMDEWQVISQKVESLDLYPCSTLLPGESATGVHPREAKLLDLLTGYFTVEELAVLVKRPVLSVAKDLYGLVMANYVVMKGLRSGKRPELPMAVPVPAPAPAHVLAAGVQTEPRLQATVPEPMPVPEAMLEPRPAPLPPRPAAANDPVKLAKLTHFAQRIVLTAKAVLPPEHHDMLNRLLARANSQLVQGEGPEAVKNLALAVSRGAVDAGCDGETVKNLNSHLKALFAK
ncbi:MAG: DUF4388 domain-containing protein [Holophaga sp.]|nr:DUF4388 domain-containing protein [Holophaga sp.]